MAVDRRFAHNMIATGKAIFRRVRDAMAAREKSPESLDAIFRQIALERPALEGEVDGGEYGILGMSNAGRPLLDYVRARDWVRVAAIRQFDPKNDDILVFVLRKDDRPYAVVPVFDPDGLEWPQLIEGHPPLYLTDAESSEISQLPITNWTAIHPVD